MESLGSGPGAAAVRTEADRHALTARAGRIGEEELSAGQRLQAALADRLDQGLIPLELGESLPLILAAGHSPARAADVVAAVDVEAAITQLRHCALIGAGFYIASKLPGCASVVAKDDMGMVRVAAAVQVEADDMVARDDQAAGVKLDAVTGAGSIPGPLRIFDRLGYFARFGPSLAIINTVGDPNSARRLAFADQRFAAIGKILAEQQPDGSCLPFDHGARDCRRSCRLR